MLEEKETKPKLLLKVFSSLFLALLWHIHQIPPQRSPQVTSLQMPPQLSTMPVKSRNEDHSMEQIVRLLFQIRHLNLPSASCLPRPPSPDHTKMFLQLASLGFVQTNWEQWMGEGWSHSGLALTWKIFSLYHGPPRPQGSACSFHWMFPVGSGQQVQCTWNLLQQQRELNWTWLQLFGAISNTLGLLTKMPSAQLPSKASHFVYKGCCEITPVLLNSRWWQHGSHSHNPRVAPTPGETHDVFISLCWDSYQHGSALRLHD